MPDAVTAAETIFDRALVWAEGEDPIRAVLLVGSRAGSGPVDELADYDLAVFTRAPEAYAADARWLARIGRAWISILDRYVVEGVVIPTRLVLFDPGVKVDFAFHPLSLLSAVARYGRHRVVLDKDGLAPGPKSRRRRAPSLPEEKDFVRLVHEFWFEAYHVAKYLRRGELWLVKSRDWATKALLLGMMEWHAQARGAALDPGSEGRRLEEWVEASVWDDLPGIFAGFDVEACRRALHATMRLFRRLAVETAEQLGYDYTDEVDANVGGFIERVVAPDATTGR